MKKNRILTLCFLSLQGALACGSSESDPIFPGDDDSAGAGGEGASSGGTGGTAGTAGSGGSAAGNGGATATGGRGAGGSSSGSSGAAGEGGTGDGGAGDGGTSGAGAGGASGDGGTGGGGGMCPDPIHPNVNGTMRTCNAGFCYCADDDGCYPDAVASSCCAVTVACGPGAMNPVATINHPGDGETRTANEPIPFVGVATDPQDGALIGPSLVWTSSELSSPIGTGLSFNASLPAGTHVITLTATDSDSNTGADTVTLTIQ
jgi:hypothetical protein